MARLRRLPTRRELTHTASIIRAMTSRTKTPPPADPEPQLLLPQKMVDPTTLRPHPKNAKLHDEAFIEGSLSRLGLLDPILVNEGTKTGRPMEILAGHGRVQKWIETRPGQPIQISLVDVDDETADLALLNMNPNPDRDPGFEKRLLLELLSGLPDLDYTQFDQGDIDALIKAVESEGDGEPNEPTPPDDFNDYDDDIPVQYGCPSCGYEWSGNPHPNGPKHKASDSE